MDYIDNFFLVLFILGIVACFASSHYDSKKDKKEREKLENTPIEVYKYSFDITMTNNKKFQMTSGCWVTYSFRKYTENNIFNNDSIKIDNEILNPQNIVEVKFMEAEKKFIRPIVNRYFGEFSIDKVYSDEEVKEREIINKKH